jgi:hypothetical protein
LQYGVARSAPKKLFLTCQNPCSQLSKLTTPLAKTSGSPADLQTDVCEGIAAFSLPFFGFYWFFSRECLPNLSLEIIIELPGDQPEWIEHILKGWKHESLAERFADLATNVLVTETEVQLIIDALEHEKLDMEVNCELTSYSRHRLLVSVAETKSAETFNQLSQSLCPEVFCDVAASGNSPTFPKIRRGSFH